MTGINTVIIIPIIACTLLLAGCNSGSTTGRSTGLPTEVEFGGNTANLVLSAVSGNHQVCPPGETLPEPLEVVLTNSEGRPLAGVEIFWTAVQGGGTVLGATGPTAHEGSVRVTTYTDSSGEASVRYVTGVIPGRNRVVAGAIFARNRPLFTSTTR